MLIFIINCRFHHFETLLNSGVATAVTFWYKVSSAKLVTGVVSFVLGQQPCESENTLKMALQISKYTQWHLKKCSVFLMFTID